MTSKQFSFGDTGSDLFRTEDADRELFDRKLRSWMPPNSFDAHAHLYDLRHIVDGSTAESFHGPAEVGYEVYQQHQRSWLGDRASTGTLFFPFPTRTVDTSAANAYLQSELRVHPELCGLMLVRPTDDPADIEAQVERDGWLGFKVYHLLGSRADSFRSETSEFLPNWIWEIAQRRGLLIMLHMVLDKALADVRNQTYIVDHCRRFPQAKLILAHAARGFCAAHTVEGISALRGLRNVFFDTSAICEAPAFEAILRTFGTTRLMYGSDFPVSDMRGHAMSLGDGFWWLYENQIDFSQWTLGRPTKVGLQSLLALQQACRTLHLRDEDIEHIFCSNARRLVGSVTFTLECGDLSLLSSGTPLLATEPVGSVEQTNVEQTELNDILRNAWDRISARLEQANGKETVDNATSASAATSNERRAPSEKERSTAQSGDESPHSKEKASGRGQNLYRLAKTLIPGGTQLLSKRPEQFAPDQWPAYFAEARGCEVVDLDGREYLDFTHNGVGACLLGYAHPDVNAAVIRRVTLGSMGTLNCADEVALAQRLLAWHPWAQQVRFARCGGESMAVATRIARAATGREIVAFCGYHGWLDWYLAANLGESSALDGHLLPGLSPAGVPRGLTGTALPFAYNNLEALQSIVSEHGSHLAAVIMEPTRNIPPTPGFLEGVRELCDQCGAKWIIDEVTAGFRFARGGVHLNYGVAPDIAVFAKALGNGHPIAAIIGRAETMQAAQDTFISSALWTEGVGFAAGLATLDVMQNVDVPQYVQHIGESFRRGLAEVAQRHHLPLKFGGYPALTTISFDHADNAALTTLMTVRMLRHGILAGLGFYPTLGHQPAHVDEYLAAADEVFAELATAAGQGDAAQRIGGPIKQSGFARLT